MEYMHEMVEHLTAGLITHYVLVIRHRRPEIFNNDGNVAE